MCSMIPLDRQVVDSGAFNTMEVAFKTKVLRTVCLSATAMDQRYGAEGGELLRRWLADIRAAECLGDVPLLAPSLTFRRFSDEVLVDLAGALKVIFKANHQKPPKRMDGEIEWSSVDRILIQRIGEAHD